MCLFGCEHECVFVGELPTSQLVSVCSVCPIFIVFFLGSSLEKRRWMEKERERGADREEDETEGEGETPKGETGKENRERYGGRERERDRETPKIVRPR